jgi:hypothetical protein
MSSHIPPPPHANSFVLGPAVKHTHTPSLCRVYCPGFLHLATGYTGLLDCAKCPSNGRCRLYLHLIHSHVGDKKKTSKCLNPSLQNQRVPEPFTPIAEAPRHIAELTSDCSRTRATFPVEEKGSLPSCQAFPFPHLATCTPAGQLHASGGGPGVRQGAWQSSDIRTLRCCRPNQPPMHRTRTGAAAQEQLEEQEHISDSLPSRDTLAHLGTLHSHDTVSI